MTTQEFEHLRKWQLVDDDGDFVGGLWVIKESNRVYPHNELAAHVLGTVNLDSEGLEGIELSQDANLRGKSAAIPAVRDALGRPALFETSAVKDIQDGRNVALSLDASLQYSVEQELKATVLEYRAKSGTAMIMNATTGEILAMANEPSFNPGNHDIRQDRRRNRAVTDGYEPGSTLKPILLASALTHSSKLSDLIYAEEGSFVIDDRRINEAEAHEKFGWISLKRMIQVSSNIAAAKLALKIGGPTYYQTLKEFGFGVKTGLEYPGEITGILSNPKQWKRITLANLGFGQGLLATPIQVMRAYAALSNGGWLVQPTIMKTDSPHQGRAVPKRILDAKTYAAVVEALESVTEKGGTGESANVPGYRIAGKTGTAQMVDPETRVYSKEKYVASFVGFLVGTEQKIVVFTSIHEPKGVYYGAQVAAPLFARILTKAVHRLGIAPTVTEMATSETPEKPSPAPTQKKALNDRLQWSLAKSQELSPVALTKMPDLAGLTLREALVQLAGRNVEVEAKGTGIIQKQLPFAGNDLAQGTLIRLTLTDP